MKKKKYELYLLGPKSYRVFLSKRIMYSPLHFDLSVYLILSFDLQHFSPWDWFLLSLHNLHKQALSFITLLKSFF